MIAPQNTAVLESTNAIFVCNKSRDNANWYAMEDGNWTIVVDDGMLLPAYWESFSYYPAMDFHRLDVKGVSKGAWKEYACTPYDLAPARHSAQLIVLGEYTRLSFASITIAFYAGISVGNTDNV
jgi:hypothetical protein